MVVLAVGGNENPPAPPVGLIADAKLVYSSKWQVFSCSGGRRVGEVEEEREKEKMREYSSTALPQIT